MSVEQNSQLLPESLRATQSIIRRQNPDGAGGIMQSVMSLDSYTPESLAIIIHQTIGSIQPGERIIFFVECPPLKPDTNGKESST